jgi:glyoxylase-like metal-dependent hydrolase (beta-lactamase superfamily II)
MEIKHLSLGMVNAYLVKTNKSIFLIDTGFAMTRSKLEDALEMEGVKPGDIKLVIITHGDIDHIGNGAYLQKKYGLKIAVHEADAWLCTSGKSIQNRKRISSPLSKIKSSILRALIIKPLMKKYPLEAFEPDMILTEGQDFKNEGFDARVVHIPGHSKGSIGIFTAEGDFFSGDTINNRKKPTVADIVENETTLAESLEKIKTLNIRTIYPGHGKPFSRTELKI